MHIIRQDIWLKKLGIYQIKHVNMYNEKVYDYDMQVASMPWHI